jgi:hypothetical protein
VLPGSGHSRVFACHLVRQGSHGVKAPTTPPFTAPRRARCHCAPWPRRRCPLPVRAVRRAGRFARPDFVVRPGLQVTASFADVTCGAPKSLRMQGVLNHAVKGRMPNNEDQLPPRPLALAVVRKAIEESRGRAAHTAEGSCLLCGSPTVETYSSLPWGTQVRLLVCADGHCGAVAAVPTRPLGVPPTLGPGTKSR